MQELQLINNAIAKLDEKIHNLYSLVNDRLFSESKQPANDNLHHEFQ